MHPFFSGWLHCDTQSNWTAGNEAITQWDGPRTTNYHLHFSAKLLFTPAFDCYYLSLNMLWGGRIKWNNKKSLFLLNELCWGDGPEADTDLNCAVTQPKTSVMVVTSRTQTLTLITYDALCSNFNSVSFALILRCWRSSRSTKQTKRRTLHLMQLQLNGSIRLI